MSKAGSNCIGILENVELWKNGIPKQWNKLRNMFLHNTFISGNVKPARRKKKKSVCHNLVVMWVQP